jgi:thymidylate synthase (FAD)
MMYDAKLEWATPDADEKIMRIARVSNPANQDSGNTNLLRYCMREGHVSPFEMANACLEINVTRDIGRQILRHRSFSFQEFSQRYADAEVLGAWEYRNCRMQDLKNRQNSVLCTDFDLEMTWLATQEHIARQAYESYRMALESGIAKEQARVLLPEGMTPSRMYMNGTMRSWVHYLQQRLHPSTQFEHRVTAESVLQVLRTVAPVTMEAFFPTEGGRV